MSAPMVTAINFDKAAYNKGDTITVTVNYLPGYSDSTQVYTGQATDQTTGLVGTLTAIFTVAGVIPNPTSVSGSDTGLRTWTKLSDVAGVAVFTAVA